MTERLRFLHTADIHLHAPHKYLGKNIQEREQDFRDMLVRMKDFIANERISIWFIAGDLWEHEHVTPPTISFLQKLFSELPNTHIFISPGNHDPYLPDSYYVHAEWPSNVTIFTSEWGNYVLPELDVCIYGIGFADPHQKEHRLQFFPGKKEGYKRHIMVMHGSVQEVMAESDSNPYAPVRLQELEELEMDYIAMGHIHKPRIFYNRKNEIIAAYPGSPESLRASEIGERYALLGEWVSEQLVLQRVPTQTRLYRRVEIDLTGVIDYNQLFTMIREQLLPINREQLLQVHLLGEISRYIYINPTMLERLGQDYFHIQWVDHTKPDYDLEQLKREHSVIAHFIHKVELKISEEPSAAKKSELEAAKRVILDAFIRKEVNI